MPREKENNLSPQNQPEATPNNNPGSGDSGRGEAMGLPKYETPPPPPPPSNSENG